MDNNMSFEEILRKIVREENETLLNSVKELLSEKTEFTIDSKPMVFDEACSYTNYSSSTMYKLTSTKKIPHAKRDGKLYFVKSELDIWMVENRVKTLNEIKEEANMRIINLNK